MVSCWSIKLTRRHMVVFSVHPPPLPPPPPADRVLFIAFGRFSMDLSGGRVAQICRYFQKFIYHLKHKILVIQPLIILNQDVVCNAFIQPYQIIFMEHDWHKNMSALKRMTVISNQLV